MFHHLFSLKVLRVLRVLLTQALFFPSYKAGRAAVFTLLSVTRTFLCACVCLCRLEVMENTNVKKFYYDVLSLIHCVPLVASITF